MKVLILIFLFDFLADGCYNYKNLSELNRNSDHVLPLSGSSLCDNVFTRGWYRFVGAAGKKCQQRVSQHTDVVQTGQVGWMVLILQWKMVKSEERSVLVTVIQVADRKKKFL